MQINSRGALAGILALVAAVSSHAEVVGVQKLAVGHTLNFPAFATHAPGDRNRLFVTELDGSIKVLDLRNPSAAPVPFLEIEDTEWVGEGGLLGLAFHPNYFGPPNTRGRGKFYVYVTVANGGDDSLGVTSPFSSHIREYTVLGNPATSNIADTDPASMREILQFVQPQDNHNAGWIGFNPAVTPGQPQYLYIASGDGGGGNDNGGGHTPGTGNAQDLSINLLGKMLRIDVNGDDFTGAEDPQNIRNYMIPPTNPFVNGPGDPTNVKDDEIFAYGLRNPFRNSFDRSTGDLWIADVGQGQREEIDFLPATSGGGENFGWRLREGNIQTPSVGGPEPADYVPPIYDYTRGGGPLQGETVIGGYRYRGPDPELQGAYFFADASDDNVWQMTPSNPVAPVSSSAVENIDTSLNSLAGINRIVSFGEDAIGRLYLVDMGSGENSGEIYRILTTPAPGDFNGDNTVDDQDIDRLAQAASEPYDARFDLDGNGTVSFDVGPPGSVSSDSDRLVRELVDVFDSQGNKIADGTEYGDLNLDGQVFLSDLITLATNYRQIGQFGWADGNFDGSQQSGTSTSPRVSLADLIVLAGHWRSGVGSGATTEEVPEPATWTWLPGVFALFFRKLRDSRVV
jgi:glucose/arabinose dehydrogenase